MSVLFSGWNNDEATLKQSKGRNEEEKGDDDATSEQLQTMQSQLQTAHSTPMPC